MSETEKAYNQNMTPMMKQYRALKEQYTDAILFFRLGDFYEMFFDDAILASRLLQITLTARNKGEMRAPMCGVPHHSAERYIAKLTKLGRKVAICEQLSDPSEPGIVKRDVVRVVTPGTTLDENVIEQKINNFVMVVCEKWNSDEALKRYEIAYADITTGEFYLMFCAAEKELKAEIERVRPAEILIEKDSFDNAIFLRLRRFFPDVFFSPVADGVNGVGAEVMLTEYLKSTQKSQLPHMSAPQLTTENDCMPLDEATLKNLELTETLREHKKEGSLLWVLDKTLTSMGGRLLRHFITHPLLRKNELDLRLDAVDELVRKQDEYYRLGDVLESVMDMERLLSKLSLGRGNPRDMVGLKNSLDQIPLIKNVLGVMEAEMLCNVCNGLEDLVDLKVLIDRAIVADPPMSMNDGGYIADGYNGELDELNTICREGKTYILGVQKREAERTGISNLKIRFNKVFGYYIEVSKSHVGKVPDDYIRKQTLVNAERFITPELKEYETKVLGAEEKIVVLEQKIFNELRESVVAQVARIQKNARLVALLDVLRSFAQVAIENNYCKPEVGESQRQRSIDIREGRHPVVEKMSFSMSFVPNDTVLDQDGERFLLITGPNMGGKSTFLRQVALITLMAQIGSFVPAKKARIGIVDRIFTRVGASDNLVRGQSTFMVEMQETAFILENATENSLIILDEIGRGTSTYDGMSIAWSVMEYIHDVIKAKTLFATHYHELIPLADKLSNAANHAALVKENEEDGVVFLFKVVPGGVDRSYGIEVAKLAGLPAQTVSRARQILSDLEEGVMESGIAKELHDSTKRVPDDQMALGLEVVSRANEELNRQHSALKRELERIDTNNMTPLEALKRLDELKNLGA